MKKVLFIALCAMFCLGSAAQNANENKNEVMESSALSAPAPATPVKPARKYVPTYQQQKQEQEQQQQQQQATDAQLVEINALIDKLKELTLNGDSLADALDKPTDIYKPILGKSKFVRRHFIYQTLDISPSVSVDKDPDLPDYTSTGKKVDDNQVSSPAGFGLNFGYSLIFVPGYEENGQLRLNRMGFAYNVGLLASFSRQDKYGTTCNFLLKSGIETGNGHMMGIGFDVLGGYGKSSGDTYLVVYDENSADDLAEPYTDWCWQYGAQLWMRSNLLHTAIRNVEMLIFARFIRSVNPNKDIQSIQNENLFFDNYWKDESWSFGVTFRYKF